jgi:hypothetical protein
MVGCPFYSLLVFFASQLARIFAFFFKAMEQVQLACMSSAHAQIYGCVAFLV